MKFNHYIFGIVLVAGSLAACDNQDIEFDDYNDEELVRIVKVMAEKNDYLIEKELEIALLDKFSNCRNSTDKFANGRLARNLFESMLLKQAIRLSETESYDDAMLQLLTIADL